ncbi:hypothetical protein EVAR_6148_1 [Eumeta japonica]|uniref:Uncharacterized protein n=1 Tax=Eumeta variegata TaxID=151549 RepID=A0A4C1TED2_EUMVA|nr:hypothetical protein EVAR_6148_1 [Eumeta japonica]
MNEGHKGTGNKDAVGTERTRQTRVPYGKAIKGIAFHAFQRGVQLNSARYVGYAGFIRMFFLIVKSSRDQGRVRPSGRRGIA